MSRWPDARWPLAAAAVLRLALFAFGVPHPERLAIERDSREYLALARNLATGRGFSQADRPPFDPDVRRTPMYPSVLAAVSSAGGEVRIAAAVSVAASVATVWALIALTARLFGRAAGPLAGLLLALDLTSAAYGTQVLTESLFTLLVVLAVLAATDPARSDLWRGTTAGTLAGLAALCRPIGVLMAAALLPACWWRTRGGDSRLLVVFAVAVIVNGVAVGAWTLRNARLSGVTTFTSQIATNTYFHRASYVAAALEGRPVESVRDEWTREFDAASSTWTEAQRIEWMHQHGRSLVVAHPFTYGRVLLDGIGRMLRPDKDVLPPLLGIDRSTSTWTILATIGWVQLFAVYALATYGIATGVSRAPAALLVPLGVVAYFLVLAGPEMYPRFRVPLMPAVSMLAAAGIVHLAKR